jgi:hypothetical protein
MRVQRHVGKQLFELSNAQLRCRRIFKLSADSRPQVSVLQSQSVHGAHRVCTSMSGKSTYLRQIGLLTVQATLGCL